MEKASLKPQIEKVLKTVIIKKYPFIDNIIVKAENIDNEMFYYSIYLITNNYNIEIIDLQLENKIEQEVRDLCSIIFQSNYDESIYRKIYSIGWATMDK